MSSPYYFQIPTQIIYGRDSSTGIGKIANNLAVKKPLVVTDSGVARSGTLDSVLAPLREAGLEPDVFDEVEPNPTIQTVDKAAARYASKGCDGVIAVGGGSALDTGKGAGVLATNPGSAADYLGIPHAPLGHQP